jgi:hypothetical protein
MSETTDTKVTHPRVLKPKPVRPIFKSREEQLIYWIKDFILFVAEILRQTGKTEMPTDMELMTGFDQMPSVVLTAYVIQVKEKFGEKLDQCDMSAVAAGAGMFSTSSTPEGVIKDITGLTDFLEKHPAYKNKFFSYWKLIKRVLDGGEHKPAATTH